MPSLKELCEKYFGCTDFYDVLRISKDADEKQVRKAYHRLSLLVHPDRVEENKKIEATEKFKVLGKVHSILSDEEKRAVYDDTGEYDEEDEIAERDWTDYWRRMFKKITIEDINKYEKQYKGSEEELNDLKHAYVSGKGSFDWILETVPFTHVEEEERIHNLLQPLIDSGELPSFDESFSGESKRTKEKRKRKWEKEAEEAEALRKEMGMGNKDDDLEAMILSRRDQRLAESEDFFDTLAAKYAPKKKNSTANKRGKAKAASPKKRGSK